MQRLSMFNLVKEGEPVFSKDFHEFFKIKKICVEHSFSSLRSVRTARTPSLRNIALGLNSVITESAGKHKHNVNARNNMLTKT